ncbi:hypothetical protein ACIQRW_34035 [Streptomyces sp. NPDC091287]|uniref:hypothetical protein n=1 Tax=Streptomyces sp. NPDC091287 TaxID=3365988 RepID=UPI0037FFC96F
MNGPEHYREAERLLAEADTILRPYDEGPCEADRVLAAAQVHASLALTAVTVEQAANTASAADINSLTLDAWYPLTHTPTKQGIPQLESAPPVAYAYRAEWGMTPLGTYTNQAAARRHCEADATNHADNHTSLAFAWIGDESEPDDPYELVIARGGPADEPTDYTVTRIEIAAEYDPEADA